MNTHKINSSFHSDFLNEKRQDPITGDLIVEGDEIVFCQECKSAFLKSSWEYLNEKHCNQSRTLSIFPVKKVLNLKSKRQYFKAHLHSISDWKQFDTQIKTLPWVLSSLDMKEYKREKNNTLTFGKVATILIIFVVLFAISVKNNLISYSLIPIGLLISMLIFMTLFIWTKVLSKDTTFVVDKNNPTISLEKDQIIVFMPYKEQKVTLAKYKVEEIELIPKEDNNYKLRVSYKGGTIFFSMNLNRISLHGLIEILYDWSNTVKIDLTKMKFLVSGMTDYSYLYASLDEEDENPNLLLP
ncbi:hypothetical protein Fleli_2965 [Bernardetia litoralis DSM 6794]|uniref:Uncharacterized protein n=1 Tax=Bernardetia litoralis (strain ATCC 23117 / DSM 6794 / NBRC 15988 / NCIMB 1366 / Fx l1 / Sio-4) TaxID=880071 RepID=I4AMX5_BERLS|nr:hypothetical protein [Bernardetia litoralis]AFM05310.1 hypothetical protein Fleli_2965 [Bernardetia litoralis DSM 6794]